MVPILSHSKVAEDTFYIKVYAPQIANKRKPGQFVIVRIREGGERIPLTIVESDPKNGSVDIIVKAIGKSTQLLAALKKGDSLLDVAGPLGVPTHLALYGNCVAIGGGVGIAALYPIAQGLKERGNHLVSILGARSKEHMILEQEFLKISDELYVVSDDGSCGNKGLVTDVLKRLVEEKYHIDPSTQPLPLGVGSLQDSVLQAKPEGLHFVVAVGPVVMMEAVCALTKLLGIPTMVSLNPLMIDGTGMCGVCRCMVDGKVKFACVDGPEFDGHKVDFKKLKARLAMFDKINSHSMGEPGCQLYGTT